MIYWHLMGIKAHPACLRLGFFGPRNYVWELLDYQNYVRASVFHSKSDLKTSLLFSHKKEWSNAICSNMDGPGDYHTKWTKSEGER